MPTWPTSPCAACLTTACATKRSKPVTSDSLTSAWFANAAAFSAAEHGRYAEALAAYRVAVDHGPTLRAAAAKEIVRLERLLEPSVAARDQERLAAMSPSLKNMLLIEGGAIMPEGPERSLVLLARGQIDEAVNAAAGSRLAGHIVRMAAASKGASSALRSRAAAMPAGEGLDETTIWLALASGVDERDASVANVLDGIDKGMDTPGAVAKMRRFLALARQGNASAAEGELDGLPMALRAQAFAAGAYLMGDRTPASWRNFARSVLFAAERPYLG